jgi:DNA-binding MarR family transcriptional regulator
MISTDEEPLEAAAVIRRSVNRLGRRLRAERPENGVSLTKLSVLAHLHRAGPMTPTTLATLERAKPQSLTRVLADLTAGGAIVREPDPADGRRVLLRLTPDGLAVLSADVRQRDAWLALAMTTSLSETEQQFLRLACELMERIADSADALALRGRGRHAGDRLAVDRPTDDTPAVEHIARRTS